ncbi:MAG: hypothetical protein GXY08_03845 [Ruminococcus sp.]|nr:hypothetical protein [Ruminococcus sp.]
MSVNELKRAVISEDELSFFHNGRDYLLYGWNQCDGYVLNLECEDELVWQSAPMPRTACAEEFISFFISNYN